MSTLSPVLILTPGLATSHRGDLSQEGGLQFTHRGYMIFGTNFRKYGTIENTSGESFVCVLAENNRVVKLDSLQTLKVVDTQHQSQRLHDLFTSFMSSCLPILQRISPPEDVKEKGPKDIFDQEFLPLLTPVIHTYQARVKSLEFEDFCCESDEHRLLQRLKQIWFGIHTPEYKSVAGMPLSSLGKDSFAMPNVIMQRSKRGWDYSIGQWRTNAHALSCLRNVPEAAPFFQKVPEAAPFRTTSNPPQYSLSRQSSSGSSSIEILGQPPGRPSSEIFSSDDEGSIPVGIPVAELEEKLLAEHNKIL